LSIAGLGAFLGAFGANPTLAFLSASASIGAIAFTVSASRDTAGEVGLPAFVAAPLGGVLAALGALLASIEEPTAWPALVGAGVAAALVNVRSWLDARGKRPVDDAVRALEDLLPPRVRVPAESKTRGELALSEVDTSAVRIGEEVLCIAGEVVPVDGVVLGGEGEVLPHPAARLPVPRRAGDPVLAGARVTDGALRLRATRVGEDRALSRVAHFGDASGPKSSPAVRRAKNVSVVGGLVAAAAAAVAIGFGAGLPAALGASGAVLLAAPLSALWRAATLPLEAAGASACARGIAFPSAEQLERAGRAHICALCTRGTVTEGVLEVMEVHPIGGADGTEVLSLVAGAELAAEEHPIARAIVRHARARGAKPAAVRRGKWMAGRGVTAITPGGEPMVVGNRQLLLDEGVSVAVADADAARAEARGDTAVFVGVAGHVRAVIALSDPVRPGARAAVQRLFDLDTEVVLLSGDHRPSVVTLAKQLDVVNVRAELRPEARGDEIRRLRETGGDVTVVGHPAEDDPALAAADVAVLLGAAGDTTDDRTIALTTHDVRDAAAALFIARGAWEASSRITLSAAAIGGLVVVAAALGFVSPVVAAFAGAAIDAYALPSGTRLLRRVELRVPAPD
jgi:Cu+-exporting ATPase